MNRLVLLSTKTMKMLKSQTALMWILRSYAASAVVIFCFPETLWIFIALWILSFYAFVSTEISRQFLKPNFKKNYLINLTFLFTLSVLFVYFAGWQILLPYGSPILHFLTFEGFNKLYKKYPYFFKLEDDKYQHPSVGTFIPELGRKLEDIDFEWSGFQFMLQMAYAVCIFIKIIGISMSDG